MILLNFNDVDSKMYDKYTFGKCLRERRLEVGYTVRGLSSEIGISPVYLSDIENGNRYAPLNNKNDVLEKIIQKLFIPKEQLDSFYEMARVSQGYFALKSYLEQENNAILFLRYAEKLDLTSEEWSLIFRQLDEISFQRSERNKGLVLKNK